MNHLVCKLFKKVEVEDEKVSGNAITDLCCILEMNTWNLSIEDRKARYGTYVSQKVMEIQINQQDEALIIDFFSKEIDNKHAFTSSILFAMGQASCQVGFEPLVDVIIKHLDEFGENEVYQAIISLERLIFFDEMRVCLLKRQEVLLLRRIY